MKVLVPLSLLYPTTQGSNTIEESLHFTSLLHHSLMTLLRLHPTTVFPWLAQLIHTAFHTEVIHFMLPATLRSLLLEIPDLKEERRFESKMKKTQRVPYIFYSLPSVLFILVLIVPT